MHGKNLSYAINTQLKTPQDVVSLWHIKSAVASFRVRAEVYLEVCLVGLGAVELPQTR